MSVRITSQESRAALFDSVSGWAFGPTFNTEEEAEDFRAFATHHHDLRLLNTFRLQDLLRSWRESRKQLESLTDPGSVKASRPAGHLARTPAKGAPAPTSQVNENEECRS